MNIVGGYDNIERMEKKAFCPFKESNGFLRPSCGVCPAIRYGVIGQYSDRQIKKYWCGAGGKPDFVAHD